MMKKFFNIFNIYVFFLMMYETLSLTGGSAMMSYLSLGPAILIAFYYIYRAIQSPKTPYMSALLVFICLIMFYGVLRFIGGETLYAGEESRPQSFFLMFMHQTPAILVFYMLTKENRIRESDIKIWFFVFLFVSVLEYRHAYETFLERMAVLGSSITEMTNNTGYYFLAVLPLVTLFNKKPIIQYGSIVFIGFFVLNSSKRGAILLFSIALFFFLYYNLKVTSKKSSKWLFIVLLTIAALIIGYRYIGRLMTENDYFYERYMATLQGESSHRDEIFSTILHHYYNDYNIIQMLFGEGAESTLRYFNRYAHNDWLQLLSDCGLLGIIIYLIYWKRCISVVIKYGKRINNRLIFILLGMSVIIAFGKTLFSMSYNSMPVSLAIALGYGMAMFEKEIQHNKLHRITKDRNL